MKEFVEKITQKDYLEKRRQEAFLIKQVLGDLIPEEFHFMRTCGVYDLTYTVENKYIIKFENQKTKKEDHKRTAELLEILRNNKSITYELPNMQTGEFDVGEEAPLFAVWYPMIKGKLIAFDEMEIYHCLSKSRQKELDGYMFEIGTFMAQLHSVPVMEVAHLFPNSIPGFIKRAVHDSLPELAQEDKKFQRRVEELTLFSFYPKYDEVLCHRDLNLWNVPRREDDSVAGIFDFGLARIGHRGLETRFWDYNDKHRSIIEETYHKTRGVLLPRYEEVFEVSAKQPPLALCRLVYERLKGRS